MKKLFIMILFSSITYSSQYQFVNDLKREEVPAFIFNLDFRREIHTSRFSQYDLTRRTQANRTVQLAGVRIDNLQPQMRQKVQKFYNDIIAKASIGSLAYLGLQAEEARGNLRKTGLSSNDRIYENIRLKMIRSIESSPVIQGIHAFKTGTLDEAQKVYQAMENLYDQRKINSNTWQELQKIYLKRQDIYKTSAQSMQAPKKDTPATLHSPEIASVKLADTTDMILTTPTDADLLAKYITADPRKDFGEFTRQFAELLQVASQHGAVTVEQVTFFTAGVAEGAAVRAVDIATDPIKFGREVVQGNVALVQSIAALTYDIITAPSGEFVTRAQMDAYEKRIEARMETVISTYNAITEKMDAMSSREYGNLIGRLGVDLAIAKGGPKAVGAATDALVRLEGSVLSGSTFFEGLQQRLGVFRENPQLITPEGVTVSAPTAARTAAEIAVDAKAAAETAQAVAQGATATIPTGDAGSLLRQDNQSTTGGGDKSGAQLLSKNEVRYAQRNVKGRTFVEVKHPVLDSVRSGSALKSDPHHAFEKIIDNFVRDASKFEIRGGDGIARELYQIEGSLNGESGVFEWIVDLRSEKGVTHRLFIKGGSITGKPNMIPRR